MYTIYRQKSNTISALMIKKFYLNSEEVKFDISKYRDPGSLLNSYQSQEIPAKRISCSRPVESDHSDTLNIWLRL